MIIEMIEKFEGKVVRPNVVVKVNGVKRRMRIDTGADISVVDENLLKNIEPTRSVVVMGFDGKTGDRTTERVNIYPVTIEFDGKMFETEAFGASRDVGLLGMNIISQCNLQMSCGICILEIIE